MPWYRKAIVEELKKTYIKILAPIYLAIALLLWRYGAGYEFVWHTIEPLSQPDIFIRAFYSAATFSTIWALLYVVGLWKLLHFICVRILHSPRFYKDVKKFIWAWLMVTTFVMVGYIVDFLNAVASFLYNSMGILLYSFPAFGFTLISLLLTAMTTPVIRDKWQTQDG